ncbi:hypothetical protein HMPREF9289_1950 [Finegoldia magna BVS033A4]|uniref:Uncharacterized protein n=1 Tax=Finegoldia magna BVS033A4 TaxID=866773 RepID=E1KY35_FINMA|nr:hypothetical protein HMPREF9289_1950 [Finegoldia magna BVS033A4]
MSNIKNIKKIGKFYKGREGDEINSVSRKKWITDFAKNIIWRK